MLKGNKKTGYDKVDIDFTNASEMLPKMSQLNAVIELAYVWCGQAKISCIWHLIHGIIRTEIGGSEFSMAKCIEEDEEEEEESGSSKKHDLDDKNDDDEQVSQKRKFDEEDLLLEVEE